MFFFRCISRYKGLPAALRQRWSRGGFTLTEIAIALGIVGLILGAIWEAYAAVHRNYLITTTIFEINSIATNIQSLYPTGYFPSTYIPGQDMRLELYSDSMI